MKWAFWRREDCDSLNEANAAIQDSKEHSAVMRVKAQEAEDVSRKLRSLREVGSDRYVQALEDVYRGRGLE